MKPLFGIAISALLCGFLLAPPGVATPFTEMLAEEPDYTRDVRPILTEHCFACHGPDANTRKAKLRLDIREEALKKKNIVPGKPDESEMINRIFSQDSEEVMPPPSHKKVLKDAQKETLKKWIAAGAKYQAHWSFVTPTRPTLPVVKNGKWVRNPIDAFILAELEKNNLEPAPEADRRTIARRLSLDLTGLPPEPADVEVFVNDKRPDAYEQYVDKLLASPHWGEHRGRYWLDYARYADTHGIHFDNFREMWTYREWVINAFNKNQPFDKFTIEQLAGDLLPNPTLEQQIASGFNRCNITTNEGGAINEEYYVLYTRDRTETTSQVYLGLTTGCAVCHDHKYDPISQSEFYSLAAFFNNTTQNAMDGNIRDTPPVVVVPAPVDLSRWNALKPEQQAVKDKVEARKKEGTKDFEAWLAKTNKEEILKKVPTQNLHLQASLNDSNPRKMKFLIQSERYFELPAPPKESVPATPIAPAKGGPFADPEQDQAKKKQEPAKAKGDAKKSETPPAPTIKYDQAHVGLMAYKVRPDVTISLADVGDFERTDAFTVSTWVKLPKNPNGAIVARMDEGNGYRGWDVWVEDNGRVGMHIINKFPENALKVVSNQKIKAGEWNHVTVSYDGTSKPEGIKIYFNAALQGHATQQNSLKETIKTTVPFKLGTRHNSARMADLVMEDLRIYKAALTEEETGSVYASGMMQRYLGKGKNEKDKASLFSWWLTSSDTVYKELNTKLRALENEQAAIKSRGSVAHIMQEKGQMAEAYVLARGEYDKRKDKVNANTPNCLPKIDEKLPKNRLGFAQWLLTPEHPLTSRVNVNRFWQEVFGHGLVRSSGDFGLMGDLPTHPALFDWLAVEFRESGWDIKKFFKLMVTSATYRQSAQVTKLKIEKDPQNKLLSRGPRFRMDAEMIRDYALASSGILVRTLGGPSVKPYQPDGVWEAVAMIGSDTRDYKQDKGEKLYRRSMYTLWKRAAPPASMDVLNAPSREVCCVKRERTNTPLQALLTMNDPQLVEAARYLAQSSMQKQPTPEGRLDYIAQRVLARPLSDSEKKIVEQSLATIRKAFQAKPEEAKKLIAVGESKADPALDVVELATLTMLTNQLLNLDEVLCK